MDRLSTRITQFLNRSEPKTEFKNYFLFQRRSSAQSLSDNTMSMFSSTDSMNSDRHDSGGASPPVVPAANNWTIGLVQNIPNLETGIGNLEGISSTEDGPPSIFSIKDLMERKSLLELDAIHRRVQARERFFSDKILLLKKSLSKQCSEALQDANEQRQLSFKLQQDVRSLAEELNEVRDSLQTESSKRVLIDDKLRKAFEDYRKLEVSLHLKNLAVEQLNQEQFEGQQQTEHLRKELHRLKLDLHLKELKLDSLDGEIADGKLLYAKEIERIKTNFQIKLDNFETDQQLLVEELEDEQKMKKRLEQKLTDADRKEAAVFEKFQEELIELENLNETKLKRAEFRLNEVEQEKAELISTKRELEMKLAEIEASQTDVYEKHDVTLTSLQELETTVKNLQILWQDAQSVAEVERVANTVNKGIIRQLKTSLDVEASERLQLSRLRATGQEELQDALNQLQEANRLEKETSETNRRLGLERIRFMASLEESKLEMENILKNYDSTLLEMVSDKSNYSDQLTVNKQLAAENEVVREENAKLSKKVQILEETRAERENLAKKEFHLKLSQLRATIKLDSIKHRRSEDMLEKTKAELNLALESIQKLTVDKNSSGRMLKVAQQQGREASVQKTTLSYKLDEATAKSAKMGKLNEISNKEANSLKDELRSSRDRLKRFQQAVQTTSSG